VSLGSEELRDLVARASLPAERRPPAFEPGDPAREVERVERRLARWRELVARGEEPLFVESLAKDGWSLEAARQALATPALRPGQPLPAWAVALADVLSAATDSDGAAGPAAAFLAVARARLVSRLGGPAGVSEKALASMLAALARSIGFLCRPSIELERELATLRARARGEGEDRAAFERALAGPGLARFLGEYAALARHVGTLVARFPEVYGEFLERLRAERGALAATFADGRDPGELVGLEVGLSDPHRGGRSVLSLEFASGLRVVYKPRGVGLDVAFCGLLDELRRRGAPLTLRHARALDRGEYGFVEHLVPRPCAQAAELLRFCRNAGALLAVVHLLEATDLHDGNVFACGPDLVPIDLETLLSPHFRGASSEEAGGQALARASRRLSRSVLRTVLLPTWRAGPGDEAADIGALGALFGSPSTDWYERNRESDPLAGGPPGSLAGQEPHEPRDLAEAVAAGFEQMAGFLSRERAALAAADGPLEAFRGQLVRILFRDTQLYMRVVQRALRPEAARDGADFAIELESFKRLLSLSWHEPRLLPVVRAEAAAMARLDIPYFRARTDGDALLDDAGGTVPDFFEAPGLDSARAKLLAFDADEVARQAVLVRASFRARLAPRLHAPAPAPAQRSCAPLPREEALAAARDVGLRLLAEAEAGDDGSLAWIGPLPLGSTGRLQLAVAALDFGSGLPGIAQALEALGRATGDARFAGAAEAALRGALDALERLSARDVATSAGLGAAAGLGSVLHGLARCASFESAEAERCVAALQGLAAGLPAVGFDSERRAAVSDGLAGLALGLASLARARPDAAPLARETALRLARRLADLGGAGLATAGFGFGRPGVALALAEAAAVLDDPTLAAAAQRAAELAVDGAPPATDDASWCRGRAGSGLALLALADARKADALGDAARRAALAAVEAVARARRSRHDGLCCGTLGEVELLLEAARRLERPDLESAAGERLAGVLARGRDAGLHGPGLLHGAAGLVAILLRYGSPAILPAFLH